MNNLSTGALSGRAELARIWRLVRRATYEGANSAAAARAASCLSVLLPTREDERLLRASLRRERRPVAHRRGRAGPPPLQY